MARVIAEASVRVKADAAGLDAEVTKDVTDAVDKAAATAKARKLSILPDVGGDTDAAETKIRAALDRMKASIDSVFSTIGTSARTAWDKASSAATTALSAVTSRLSQVGQLWDTYVTNPASRAWSRVRQSGEDAWNGVTAKARTALAPIADMLEPIATRMRSVGERVGAEFANVRTYGEAAMNMIRTRAESAADSVGGTLGRGIGKAAVAVLDLSRKFGDAGEKVGGFANVASNAARQISSGLVSALQGLGSIGDPILSALTSKIALIGVGIVAATGALGGAVVAFPALAAAAAGPLAAVALGMDGIKRAAATITPQLNSLKAAVSSTFQTTMTPVFQRVGVLLDSIHGQMQDIAGSLGMVAQAMSKVILSTNGISVIKGLLDGVTTAVQNMVPGLTAGSQAFLRLAQIATPALAQIGSALGDIAQQWANAINRMADTGILQQALAGLVAVLRVIGPLFGTLIEIIGRLAASLGGPIANAISGLQRGLQNGQSSITQFGDALGRIFNALAPVLEKVIPLVLKIAASMAQQLAPAAEVIAPIIGKIADALSGWSGPIASAIIGLAGISAGMKVFNSVSGAVSTINDLAKGMRGVGEAADDASKASKAWAAGSKIASAASGVWTAAQWLLNAAMDANPIGIVIVVIGLLVAAFIYAYTHSETFRNAVNGALTAVGNAAKAVGEWFANLGSKIGSFFSGLGSTISSAFNAVIGWFERLPGMVGSALSALGTAIATGAKAAWNFLSQTLPAAIQAAIDWLGQLPMKAAYALGYLAGEVFNAAKAAWNFLSTTLPAAIQAAIDWLTALPGRVVSGLVALGSAIASGARTAWNWLLTTAQDVGSAVLAWVEALPGRIVSGLSALASDLQQTAVTAWTSFKVWAVNLGNELLQWVRTLPQQIQAGLAALAGFLQTTATNAWNGFLNTTKQLGQEALAWIQALPGKIKAFFSDAGSWLLQAGKDILTGLWNGLKSMASAVLDWIGSLGSQIAAGFKAAVGVSSPSTLFHGFGVNILEGLRNGLRDNVHLVLDQIDDLAKQMWSRWLRVAPQLSATGAVTPGSGAGTASRTQPLIARDTGLLQNNEATTAINQTVDHAAVAAATAQGVYQAMTQVLQPISQTGLARIATRGTVKNDRK